MQNKMFKFPNGVTLDLSGIKEEPCKVFIKGGYISRITDRLKKEETQRLCGEFMKQMEKDFEKCVKSIEDNLHNDLMELIERDHMLMRKSFKCYEIEDGKL